MYLSADTPRWMPEDENALQQASDGGLLAESHHLDIKALLAPGSSKNKELARDLASFAIDGGVLIIGITEHDDRALELTPVEVAGLAERIEQVARTIPDPPLPVTTRVIPAGDLTGAGPGHGYLLVQVPATGTAPHMVEGAYMGRGDKTKHRLSDAEVIRLHRLRDQATELGEQELDAYVTRDPVPADLAQQAHAFVVATPARPRPEMLLDARADGSWTTTLHKLLDAGAYRPGTILERPAPYDPQLRSVQEFSRRADGAALTCGLTETREPEQWHEGRPPTEDIVELEVTEEGAVRVLTTRLGDSIASGTQVVFEDVLPDLVRRALGIVGHVADLTGYSGTWRIGVAATGLAGKSAYRSGQTRLGGQVMFPVNMDSYSRHVEASTAEVQQTPGAVTRRLTGRFLRVVAYDQAPAVQDLFSDDDGAGATQP